MQRNTCRRLSVLQGIRQNEKRLKSTESVKHPMCKTRNHPGVIKALENDVINRTDKDEKLARKMAETPTQVSVGSISIRHLRHHAARVGWILNRQDSLPSFKQEKLLCKCAATV